MGLTGKGRIWGPKSKLSVPLTQRERKTAGRKKRNRERSIERGGEHTSRHGGNIKASAPKEKEVNDMTKKNKSQQPKGQKKNKASHRLLSCPGPYQMYRRDLKTDGGKVKIHEKERFLHSTGKSKNVNFNHGEVGDPSWNKAGRKVCGGGEEEDRREGELSPTALQKTERPARSKLNTIRV